MRFPTRKEFAKFIDKHSWGGMMQDNSCKCPIATKLREKDPDCRVYHSNYVAMDGSHLLPKWAVTFVAKFDDSDGSQAAAREIMKELM